MTTGKHTPGPWHSDYWLIYDATALNRHIARMVPDSMPEHEIDANARLIAAAPDLLAALQECLSVLNMLSEPDAIKSTSVQHAWTHAIKGAVAAKSAIAKAIAKATAQ